MKQVIIIGAGGFGREVAWLMERVNARHCVFEILGFCDDAPDKQNGKCGKYRLLGAPDGISGEVFVFCAIGDNKRRKEMTARCRERGLKTVSVIDPSAQIAPDVDIGCGSYVGINSIVSVGSRLGDGSIVNHGVCIGHDVVAGAWAQFCPGVCVSGGCNVGEGALVGTLGGTIPLKRVGAWSVIGAGTVPLRDVPDATTIARIR